MNAGPPAPFSLTAINRKRGITGPAVPRQRDAPALADPLDLPAPAIPAAATAEPNAPALKLPFDPLRVVDALVRRWWLMLLAGLVCSAVMVALGWLRFETLYSARSQIIKQQLASAFRQSDSGESFKPSDLTIPTLNSLMYSGATIAFVTPDSKLYFDLLPGTQLREEMEKMLTRYYKQQQVSLTPREVSSQRVWVLGRVNSPGIYPLNRPMRVLDAVTQAGGLFASSFTGTTEELADLSHSFLMRGGKMLPVDFQKLIREGDLSQNIYIEPDDFIYLPSSMSNEVYVLGAVTEPRPVGFMNEMNLITALGRGLGVRPEADLTHVTIVRGSLTEPKIATVNASDIIQGRATNVRLEPGDIVYVPGRGSMSPGGFFHDAVNTFTRLVAANEGNAAPIGLNLNIGSSSSTQ